jgi:predicted RND superfamily exporter protein
MKIADIGSHHLDDLIENRIKPELSRLFGNSDTKAYATGSTILFVKGNKFLISNLQQSLILAFILISLVMTPLFANKWVILFSLVSNIIPMMITAGLMGFTDLPFKPSTAIVFSVAFGISVDYSIHFLAKYRQELFANNFFVPLAVSKTIREIGTSMIYSAVVLFAGFVIFVWSGFGGTIALGKLTSITLLIAMFTNLIFLPSLLLAFDSGRRRKDAHALIDNYDNFYHEDEDEEIDLEQIHVDKKNIETAKTS